MTAVVFASPPSRPESARLVDWDRFGATWFGVDGSEWDLRSVVGGLILTTEGLQALGMPLFEVQASESPATDGRRRTDYRLAARSVSIPVYLWSDAGSPEFQTLYRRWMKAFHPLKPGRLRISTAAGFRDLVCYFDAAGDGTLTHDPLYQGWLRMTMTLTAEDPWWLGAETVRTWFRLPSEPFFGNDGNLHISDGPSTDQAVLTNTGDTDAWGLWELAASQGTTSALVTVDGGSFETPQVAVGQMLTVDTDPAVATALLDGTDVTGAVDPWDPRPVPAGDDVPLSLILDGYGSITVRFRTKHFTAFG